MSAWGGWYHCTGSTYGQWLRGDPRGWRARHHRQHVEGDYKNPPPEGTYDQLYQKSLRLMKHSRVSLDWPQRVLACEVMAQSLQSDDVEFVDLCVGKKHWHALIRSHGVRDARHWIGRAKGRSARALSKAGLVPMGGVWAVRCKALPLRDAEHKRNVSAYIPAHAKKGAAVWSILVAQGQIAPTPSKPSR